MATKLETEGEGLEGTLEAGSPKQVVMVVVMVVVMEVMVVVMLGRNF